MQRRIVRLAAGALVLLITIIADIRPLASQPPARTVKMRLAADEALRLSPDWEQKVRGTVAIVSDIYEKNFQIKFKITEIVHWESGLASGDPHVIIERLKKQLGRSGADILVGFSGLGCSSRVRGTAATLGAEAVIMMACDYQYATPERILSHELAHLFGAFHVKDRRSVMAGGPAGSFDPQTAKIIGLMRNFDFGGGYQGLDHESKRQLISVYREATEVDPQLVHARLGAILLMDGRPSEALPSLAKAAAMAPRNAFVRHNLGNALLRIGEVDKAIGQLHTAIEIDPHLAQSYNELGVAFAIQGRLAESAGELQKAIQIEPGNAHFRGNLGLTLARDGKFADAVVAYREALRLDPAISRTRYGLVQALCSLGRKTEAHKEFQKLLRFNPDYRAAPPCAAPASANGTH